MKRSGPPPRRTPLRFAYADPPYLGCALKLYGDETYDDPDAHVALMGRMEAEYDGWAMSLHEPSLRVLLPMAPEGVRVAAWVKPFASFKPGVNPGYTWEPVIYRTCATSDRERPTVKDHCIEPIALRKGLAGAKPHRFCVWLFDLLGMTPDDEFADLFPGSGAVTRSHEQWSGQTRLAL